MRAAMLALLAVFLFGCNGRGPGPGAVLPHRPVFLWVDWQGAGRYLDSDAGAERFCRIAAKAGVTHLLLEARNAEGEWMLGDGSASRRKERRLRRMAKREGLDLGAVLPLFLPEADSLEEIGGRLSHKAVRTPLGVAAAPTYRSDGGLARLSAADREARERDLAAIGRIVSDGDLEVIFLSGLGFDGYTADVGPAGRRSFEDSSGITVKDWPVEVTGPDPPSSSFEIIDKERGGLWNRWLTWRANLLRNFLLEVKPVVEEGSDGGKVPHLAILVDAPYPMHLREGLNWAWPLSPAGSDNKWLPPGYGQTGAGHLLGGIGLIYWRPWIYSAREAREQGFAWWASVEGAMATARRYLPPEAKRWAALELDGTEDSLVALEFLARRHDGVLVIGTNWMEDVDFVRRVANILKNR